MDISKKTGFSPEFLESNVDDLDVMRISGSNLDALKLLEDNIKALEEDVISVEEEKCPGQPAVSFLVAKPAISMLPPESNPNSYFTMKEFYKNSQTLSLIKEYHSAVDSTSLLTVTKYEIVFSGDDVKIQPSGDDDKMEWKLEENFEITKLLIPTRKHSRRTKTHSSTQLQLKELTRKSAQRNEICYNFLGPLTLAYSIVMDTLKEAQEKYRHLILMYGDEARWRKISSTRYSSNNPNAKKSRWPSIETFTKENMLMYIKRYIISCSQFKENWKYVVTHQCSDSDEVSDHYQYEAKFGLPNPLYPIPQATASIYFYVEVSKAINRQCPIKVLLSVEMSRHKVNPDHYIIKDRTLLRILRIKIKQIKRIKF